MRFTVKITIISLILAFALILGGCGSENKQDVLPDKNVNVQEANQAENNVICFIPLDIRPCCLDIPLEIAKIAGAEVLSPDMDKLTFFKDEPDTAYVRSWLKENAPSCNSLVISMEQLVYGGLIQSRFDNRNTDLRDEALQLLRDIKTENPDIKIYLSNVLMRTYPSVFSKEDQIWWEKINEYSKAYYACKILNQESARDELKKLTAEIPSDILETFLAVRAVNHELNLICIDLVNEGIADKLIICQEDCNEGGIQNIEQVEIEEKIKSLELNDKISLANGTDEAGAELLMYAAKPEGCSASVCWLGKNTDFVANYEDRKFKENLSEHTDFINIKLDDSSDNVLCILVPKNNQGDYAEQDFTDYEAYTEAELMAMSKTIKSLTDSGKHCYILDLDCANGGNIDFLILLSSIMDIKDIYGYSGWNTASNSLGTLLAQLIATDGSNSDINRNYTAARIIDEAVYQGLIRPIMDSQEEERGENISDFEDPKAAEQWLCEEFESQEDLIRKIFGGTLPDYTASLRWPRNFEISVVVN